MTQITTPVLLSNRDTELARSLIAQLESNPDLAVGDLPEPVVTLVRQILFEMGQGHAV